MHAYTRPCALHLGFQNLICFGIPDALKDRLKTARRYRGVEVLEVLLHVVAHKSLWNYSLKLLANLCVQVVR